MIDAGCMTANLRYHHRIQTRGDVALESRAGQMLSARLVDISVAGVSVACDRMTLEELLPPTESRAPCRRNTVPVTLHFSLPQKGQAAREHHPITTECNIIYTRRTSRDTFHLGLEFNQLATQEVRLLDCYINSTPDVI